MVNETANNLVGKKLTAADSKKITKKRSFLQANKPSGELLALPTHSAWDNLAVNQSITGRTQRATQHMKPKFHKAELKELIKIVPKLSMEDLSQVLGSILKRLKRDPLPAPTSLSKTPAIAKHS